MKKKIGNYSVNLNHHNHIISLKKGTELLKAIQATVHTAMDVFMDYVIQLEKYSSKEQLQ